MHRDVIKDATGTCIETISRTLLSLLLLILVAGIALIAALIAVRIMAIRFSPKRRTLWDGL